MKARYKELSTVKSGQSLIEVVIALGVIVALAVSLVTASLVTQKSSRSAKNNTQAAKLAQQSVEQIRVFRDRVGFSALANNNCWVMLSTDTDPINWKLVNSGSSPSATCPEALTLNETNFSRSIKIEAGTNALQKKVTVTVTWTDSGGLQTVTNVTYLSDCVSSQTAC